MLEAASEYIALDSQVAAQQLAVNVVAAAESLSDFSERGRIVPELKSSEPRYRELLIGAYRLVYLVEDDHVAIVAFVHGARDFRSWWKRLRRERRPN
jgi:plasmid stabilization system protein ParE